MTPAAILQLHFLPRCVRRLALMLACSLMIVPTAQNLPSSRPPQSPADGGMRLRNFRRTEGQRLHGFQQGQAIPHSRPLVVRAANPRNGVPAQSQLFLDTGPPQYATGDDSQAMAGGDFNGDGQPDLVAVYSNFASVLLGNRDGTFQAHVDYPTASSPRYVAVADFNRDGHLDIVTSSGNYVSVLLGNGDGTFQTHLDYAVCSGGLTAADFNGDGNPDLAFPSCDNNSVTVLLGKGDGTFQSPVNSPVGSGAASIAVGDFNNDGKADLAVSRSIVTWPPTYAVTILLGKGDGTFQAPVDYSNIEGPVAVADFNQDGKLDLVGSYGVELLGNGDGTFGNPVNTGVYWSNDVVVGDFNHDGKVDLAFPNLNSVSVWLGNGDGTFKSAGDYSTGFAPFSVVVGDFNGDGKADLTVLNNYGSSVSVLLGHGDGTFPNPPLYPIDADADQMVSGDFNGDGIADLVVANSNEQTVSILLANGDGTFQPKVDSATGGRGLPGLLAVGDFNRDGHADIAISSDAVIVLLGKGNGSFQPPVSYPVLPSVGTSPGAVAVGDFNGDGIPDLAVANGVMNPIDGWVSILLGNGDGTFREHVEYPTGGFPGMVAVGDLNGDGKADLVVTINSAGGSVNVLLGNGNGTFQAPVAYASGLLYPGGVAIGDFNGDGKPDLVVDHADSAFGSSVSVLIGNGDGSFETPVEYETGGTPSLIGIGDFNGDGILDLAVNTRGISLDILLGNGDGTFQPYEQYGKGEVWSSATIADFNGDGALDVGFNLPFGPASVILNLRGTALDLQSSQSAVLLGQSVTFTATIHAGLNGVSLPSPTGTIKFMDGTNQLGAQTLGANGVATFSTLTLTSGTHNISAVYSGDANFNPHTVALVQVVNGPDFAINATPGTATLRSGGSAVFSLAVSPMYGFNGSVSLTCSVSPTPALAPTCSLNPTSVTPTASGSAASKLTIATTGSTTALLPIRWKIDSRPFYAVSLPVFGLLLLGAGVGTRGSRKRKFLMGILLTNLLAVGLGSQMGCGGSATNRVGSSGTPAGKYAVTVNAASGSATHTTSVTLTVQ